MQSLRELVTLRGEETVRVPRQHARAEPVGVKTAHTLIWFSIEPCVLYLLYSGVVGRSDRRAAIAGCVVAGEAAVFAVNGFRCPMTALAESPGAERGSVTDLYLPAGVARNLPAIHVPLVIAAALLHARNVRRVRRASRCGGAGQCTRSIPSRRAGVCSPTPPDR